MVWAMQQGACCQAGVAQAVVRASWISSRVRVHCGRQQLSVVKFDKRSELFDQLKRKNESSILVRMRETMTTDRRLPLLVRSAVASQALQDKATQLFAHVCVAPGVLSHEAADFMLSVAASHATLSEAEATAASQADLILRGVQPTSFKPVLLVCTTTRFAMGVAISDVEKARRRAELWQRAVGPAFLALPVVAGYEVSPEVGAFSKDMGVASYDISK